MTWWLLHSHLTLYLSQKASLSRSGSPRISSISITQTQGIDNGVTCTLFTGPAHTHGRSGGPPENPACPFPQCLQEGVTPLPPLGQSSPVLLILWPHFRCQYFLSFPLVLHFFTEDLGRDFTFSCRNPSLFPFNIFVLKLRKVSPNEESD